jgi:hypothetical protein
MWTPWLDWVLERSIDRRRLRAPPFAESAPLSRDYEDRLYAHYGRPPYWLRDAEHKEALSLSGV